MQPQLSVKYLYFLNAVYTEDRKTEGTVKVHYERRTLLFVKHEY